MLEIKDLKARVDGNEILKGINLYVKAGEVHAIMGPNGSGKSTLSSVIAGNPKFEKTGGSITFLNEDIDGLSPEERAHRGIFLSFQYPVEIPGVSVNNFIKTAINEKRKSQGLDEIPAGELLRFIREKASLVELDPKFLSRSLNEGFSGGEKNGLKYSRWQLSNHAWPYLTRRIPDWTSMRCVSSQAESTNSKAPKTPR